MYVNWYKISKIRQEAGLKESIPSALLMALMSLLNLSKPLNGAEIEKASQKYNVSQSIIEQALSNPQIVQAVQGNTQGTNSSQQTPSASKKDIQVNIIARTIYREGMSESIEGLNAIATVIYNRSNKTPDGMIETIKKPKHFSCWNSASESDWSNMKQGSGHQWNISVQLAKSMIDGTFKPSGKWNHYYNPSLANPSWAYTDKNKKQIRNFTDIGNHRFMIL